MIWTLAQDVLAALIALAVEQIFFGLRQAWRMHRLFPRVRGDDAYRYRDDNFDDDAVKGHDDFDPDERIVLTEAGLEATQPGPYPGGAHTPFAEPGFYPPGDKSAPTDCERVVCAIAFGTLTRIDDVRRAVCSGAGLCPRGDLSDAEIAAVHVALDLYAQSRGPIPPC